MERHSFHYTQSDLASALRKAGIKKRDVVFSHIGILNLGIPKEIYARKTAVDVVLGAILEVIGSQGTFLTPTYSYSFCKNQIFDPQETPSTVGVFGNKFRKLKSVKRSLDPIFSVAGIGPEVYELFLNLPHTCFGKDCLYDRLTRLNAKVCNIGLDLTFITPIHYFEEYIGVPYRFRKLFSGYLRLNGKIYKENWIYSVRVLGDFSYPAAQRLWKDALKEGFARVVPVGLGQVASLHLQDAFNLCKKGFKKNLWYLAKGPACNPLETEKKRVGVKEFEIKIPKNASMEQIINSLWKLPRDIVSDGYDAALESLAKQVPMTIHGYHSGTECFTWIVPEKWTCHEAYLQTLDGRKLFSYADNPLHVVSYSLPFDGEVSRDELFQHLHVHPELRDAIPFVFKYYERDWGLCCSKKLKDSLTDAKYRVFIKTDFSYSTLKVGEIIVQGKVNDTFILCAHLCHPHMVNDDLSGVVVGINVMRALLKQKGLHYTYRFLILPETVGSAAYLSHNENLILKIFGGLFLEMLATDYPHLLKYSIFGNTSVDKCIATTVKKYDPKAQITEFFEELFNDERMFNAPGINVPMLSLSRALSGKIPYKEYHSSLDIPENANFQNLYKSYKLVLKIIDAIEKLRIPIPKFKGEIFCSRFDKIDYSAMGKDILKVIFYLDGKHSTADIAQHSGITFAKTKEVLHILKNEDLIE